MRCVQRLRQISKRMPALPGPKIAFQQVPCVTTAAIEIKSLLKLENARRRQQSLDIGQNPESKLDDGS